MTSKNGQIVEHGRQPTPTKRDIRVTAVRPLRRALRQRPLVTTTSAFADALLARYLKQNPAWQRLGLIFQRPQAGHSMQHGGSRVHVNVAPRLQLTLLHYGAADRPSAAVPATSTTPAWSLNRPTLAKHVTQAVQRVYRAERLEARAPMQTAQRLLDRSLRVNAVAKPGAPVTLRAAAETAPAQQTAAVLQAPAPAAQPVPRIVARASMGRSDAEEGTAQRAPRQAIAGEPLLGAPARTQVTAQVPPTLDINRVAEQVMQQIDRRILAHRERTGRI